MDVEWGGNGRKEWNGITHNGTMINIRSDQTTTYFVASAWLPCSNGTAASRKALAVAMTFGRPRTVLYEQSSAPSASGDHVGAVERVVERAPTARSRR